MRERLAALLRELSVRRGEFVLASGETSTYYLDVRKTALTASGARLIGVLVWESVQNLSRDIAGCGGLTLGADPILTATCCAADDAGSPQFGAVIVRKQGKEHGTRQRLEIAGTLGGTEELVVVDDVITTAGSTIEAVTALREHGFTINHAVCVVDRQAGGADALAAIGIELHPLFTASELLD